MPYGDPIAAHGRYTPSKLTTFRINLVFRKAQHFCLFSLFLSSLSTPVHITKHPVPATIAVVDTTAPAVFTIFCVISSPSLISDITSRDE